MQLSRIRKGMNLWPAIQWEASSDPKDHVRLDAALLQLKSLGVDWVRVLASSQRCSSPYSIRPAIEEFSDQEDHRAPQTLLRLLDRLKSHDLQAVVVLGNFWSWSGGFPAYAEWSGHRTLPVVGPEASIFQLARFFVRAARLLPDSAVMQMYHRFIHRVLDVVPEDHSAILCFQLANEPTPFFNSAKLLDWAQRTVELIRSRAKKVPLSLGGIGEGPLPFATKTPLEEMYLRCSFQFLTAHIWPENWGWYDPKAPERTFDRTLKKTSLYLRRHAELARRLNSPLLLEEFNLARDDRNLNPESPTQYRNRYFQFVHEELSALHKSGFPIGGLAYWTWELDPPHEPQGWYGIHASDESTLRIIRDFSSPSGPGSRPK